MARPPLPRRPPRPPPAAHDPDYEARARVHDEMHAAVLRQHASAQLDAMRKAFAVTASPIQIVHQASEDYLELIAAGVGGYVLPAAHRLPSSWFGDDVYLRFFEDQVANCWMVYREGDTQSLRLALWIADSEGAPSEFIIADQPVALRDIRPNDILRIDIEAAT